MTGIGPLLFAALQLLDLISERLNNLLLRIRFLVQHGELFKGVRVFFQQGLVLHGQGRMGSQGLTLLIVTFLLPFRFSLDTIVVGGLQLRVFDLELFGNIQRLGLGGFQQHVTFRTVPKVQGTISDHDASAQVEQRYQQCGQPAHDDNLNLRRIVSRQRRLSLSRSC